MAQFGTKRLDKNPLDELLELQNASRVSQQNKALQMLNRFKYKPIFKETVGDETRYYEKYTDRQTGEVRNIEIPRTVYEKYELDNQQHNHYRSQLGVNEIEPETAPPPVVKEPGLVSKTLDWVRGKLSSDKKPVSLQTKNIGDPGKNILQPTNNNVAGTNTDITKPVKGGAVKTDISDMAIGNVNNVGQAKIETTPSGIPMDVTNQDQARDIRTERAYQKSISQKGKRPPGMTDKEYADQQNRLERERRYRTTLNRSLANRQVDPNSPLGKYWASQPERDKSGRLELKRDKEADLAIEKGMLLRDLARKDALESLSKTRPDAMANDIAWDTMTLTPEQMMMITGGKPDSQTITMLPPKQLDSKLTDSKGKPIPPPVQYAGKGQKTKKDYGTKRFRTHTTPEGKKAIEKIKTGLKKGDKKIQEWMSNYLDYQQSRPR